MKITTKVRNLFWTEGPNCFTSQSSLGFIHISKISLEAYIYNESGTHRVLPNVHSIKELMKKINDLHVSRLKYTSDQHLEIIVKL